VKNAKGNIVAYFYLDPYARPGKRGGAWMDDARGRRVLPNGEIQVPVAYLVCNFAPPVKVDGVLRQPTITHDDVITLFHESGHGLHHLLTQVSALGVSGINGVEWDAVELPSQFMENFCWEWEVLEKMTAHAETGKPLPRELFEKILAAKNFQNGYMTLRQIVMSLTDWRLHASFDAKNAEGHAVLNVSRAIADQFNVIPQPAISRWINTFSHIFAGGYAAGYYSYKWAEVLSADTYAAFEEAAEKTGNAFELFGSDDNSKPKEETSIIGFVIRTIETNPKNRQGNRIDTVKPNEKLHEKQNEFFTVYSDIRKICRRNSEKDLLIANALPILKVIAPEIPAHVANLLTTHLLTTEDDAVTLRKLGDLV
jgi:hypothetical protein